MNTALWVAQGVLAAVYLVVGGAKLVRPPATLRSTMGWVEDYPELGIKLVGAAEVAGALGVVLPWATGVAPVLTPLAATGLVTLQVLAIQTHIRRGEYAVLPVNVILLGVALFVAIGRFPG